MAKLVSGDRSCAIFVVGFDDGAHGEVGVCRGEKHDQLAQKVL